MAGYIGSKASVVSSGAERKKTFAITTNTTSLTGLSYTVNQVHVFHNGVRLVDGTDYTATNGTSITLTSAAENGDEIVVISYAAFQTSDTVSASAGGTFAGDVSFSGNVSVDGGTIKLDGNYPTGTDNVALGNLALDDGSLSGAANTGIGASALTANTSGEVNTAVGGYALSDNTSGTSNSAFGVGALGGNTTGGNNTGLGKDALRLNTTASYNVGVGEGALYLNTTGEQNTALGRRALYSQTSGLYNTAVGLHAGYYQTGSWNTFIGHDAGSASGFTGSKNTILGRYNGNQGGLDIRTSSNNIVLSDGDGNVRAHCDSSGTWTGVGASTTFGAVGTYIWGRPANLTDYSAGATASGLYATSNKHPDTPPYYTSYASGGWDSAITVATSVSGTWRCMAGTGKYNSNYAPSSLWVRIS